MAGESWQLSIPITGYAARLVFPSHFCGPENADTVYVLNTGLSRSTDAARASSFIRAPHGDNHGLWIDPNVRMDDRGE